MQTWKQQITGRQMEFNLGFRFLIIAPKLSVSQAYLR